MPVFHPPRFPSEVHLNIKDYVSGSSRVPRFWTFSRRQNVKRNAEVRHLLLDRVLPVPVAVLLIDRFCVFDLCWNFNAVLVCRSSNTRLDSQNDAVPFLQRVRNPPRKCRHVVNLMRHSIFHYFNRMRLLQIF